MKLRNKRTGEIVDYISFKKGGGQISMYVFDTNKHYYYDSLAELNEEWEDYEEPKKYWGIGYSSCRIGGIEEFSYDNDKIDEFNKSIGNYFETREEAEKAVRKLKAWKRLKDKGFSFNDWDWKYQNIGYNLDCTAISEEDVIEAEKDLDLLFGGEE